VMWRILFQECQNIEIPMNRQSHFEATETKRNKYAIYHFCDMYINSITYDDILISKCERQP